MFVLSVKYFVTFSALNRKINLSQPNNFCQSIYDKIHYTLYTGWMLLKILYNPRQSLPFVYMVLQSVLMHFCKLYSILCQQFATMITSVSRWHTGTWWSSHMANTAELRVSLFGHLLVCRLCTDWRCTHTHTHTHTHTDIFLSQLGFCLFHPFTYSM